MWIHPTTPPVGPTWDARCAAFSASPKRSFKLKQEDGYTIVLFSHAG